MCRSTGRTVYTGMLNERGGYESDFTVTMLDHNEYMIVTGSAQAVRDRDVIERAFAAMPEPPRCEVIEVTSMFAVIAVMGPRSRELLQRVSTARFFDAGFPFGDRANIDVGYATVRATRLTYVGELGWELYVPVEFAVGVYEALHGGRRRSRHRERRLLRDRLVAPGKRLSRVGPRAVAGHRSVRSGARIRGEARQAGRLSWPRRAGGGSIAAH